MNNNFRKRFYENYLTTQVISDGMDLKKEINNRSPYLKYLIKSFVSNDKNIKVLDLACGYGAFLFLLKEAGYNNLQGVDVSSEQIEAAKKLGLSCVFVKDILETLKSYADSSIDLLVAMDILEHCTKEEALQIVDEMFRVLDGKGRVIIHVPNGEAIFSGSVYFSDLTHETNYTRRSVTQLMKMAGFKTIRLYEDTPIVHGIKSAIRFLLWKFFRSFFCLIYMSETGDHGKELILTQNILAIVSKNQFFPKHENK